MFNYIDFAIGSLGPALGLHARGGHQGAYPLILCRRYRDFVWACLLAGLLRSKLLRLLCVQQLARGQVALSLLIAFVRAMDTIFSPPCSLLLVLESSLILSPMLVSSPEDRHRQCVFLKRCDNFGERFGADSGGASSDVGTRPGPRGGCAPGKGRGSS